MATQTLVITLAGGEVHALIDGDPGRPWLTALHALATDSRLWDAQVPGWMAEYRVLRLDMRGHGSSPFGSGPSRSIESLAADVAAVWDALEIERSVLVGLSIGGMIALDIALASPDRVVGVVAAACRSDAPAFFQRMWEDRRALLSAGGLNAVAEATLPTWFTPRTIADRPDRIALVREMIEATSPEGYVAATRALQALDLKPRLSTLSVPVLYAVGEADGAHPEAMADMARITPGARIETIPGAGHLANIEQPDAFAAATLPFLEEIARHAPTRPA